MYNTKQVHYLSAFTMTSAYCPCHLLWPRVMPCTVFITDFQSWDSVMKTDKEIFKFS